MNDARPKVMRMSDFIGKSFGRYHILAQLGEGGMATVYKAFDTRLERDVAVKIIRKGAFPTDHVEHILKRFEREAKSLARLSHSSIIKVLDYGEYEGLPYLVMEYLPSGTLKQQMGKPIPWQEAIQLLMPIAEALDYAHSQNMIHRDVKPANILLTDRGQPMLTDFGIAKVLDLEETIDLTGTSAAVGTPEYMAPEQATAKTVDHRADIYALGVVFYEMVTGRKPFIADTPLAVLFKHVSDPLPSPLKYVPDLPEGAEKMLLKALAKKPEHRYQSMAEMMQGFERLLGSNKQPVRKSLREKAEKPKAVEEKPARKKIPIATKTAENQTMQRSSRTQVAFWVVGFIAVIFVISMLAFNNANKLQELVSTSTYTSSPGETPDAVMVSTKSFTAVDSSTALPTTEVTSSIWPIVGKWSIEYKFACSGNPIRLTWDVQPDGILLTSSGEEGNWVNYGNRVEIQISTASTVLYTGRIDGDVMSGIMTGIDGCWSAQRIK
jgi:serine/threonine protein kinase